MEKVPVLDAGELRHRIKIEAPTDTRDNNGGIIVTWNEVAPAWAKIEPLSGRELEVARQSYADVTHKILMRWRSEFPITNKHRINFGGKYFNVVSALNLSERNIQFQILAREVLGA